MAETAHDISVIICAYTEDRWDDLVAAIESVQQQSLRPREIVVVIDHNPALMERARQHIGGVLAVENREAKGLSGARNSGVTVAQGAVIAFLDDDAIADPNWLKHLATCYTDPHVLGVGGKIEPLWLGTRPSWFPDEFNWVVGCTYRGMPAENATVRNVIGANMSVRRHALIAVGGFRESFGCNYNTTEQSVGPVGPKWLQHHAGDEETEFCIRATQQWPDAKWLYTPSATIQHRVSVQRTYWTYFLWRCYDEGLGKAMLVGLHGMQAGLSSERTYTFKTLPLGVMHGLTDVLFHHDLTGLARAGAIVVGLVVTMAAYLIGSTFLRLTNLKNTIFKKKLTQQDREVEAGNALESEPIE
jgi:glycosyltransferase involved in cell wall biosynthesis